MGVTASLINRTPFAAQHCVLPNGRGGEVVLVVVKASFVVGEDGAPALAPAPVEPRLCDEFRGDPKRGWPRWDSDLALFKPRMDVVVEAMAYAPPGRVVEQLVVELELGSQLRKRLQVTGDRLWDGEQPGAPTPFSIMPLGWERAYGGTRTPTQVDERNPVGIGYERARSSDPEVGSELPNVEDPSAALTHPSGRSAPAGLATIGRAWLPRRSLAGTFDDAWKRRRWPLAPRDFDPAFNQSAPIDQQLDHPIGGDPIGGEVVRLVNLTPEGEWCFRLPTLDVPVHLVYEDRLERAELRVDTVEIEAERRTVILTGRFTIAMEPRRKPLAQIVLGHVAPAWIKAKRAGKCHVDLRAQAELPRCFF